MKKIVRIMAIILVCVMLVGCGNNNAKVKLASKKLTSELDKIISQVKKMENIDTKQIDISSYLGTIESEYYDDDGIDDDGQGRDVYSSKAYRKYGEPNGYMRKGTPMRTMVPTGNHLVKQTSGKNSIECTKMATLGRNNTKRAKNFNFVSKEAEENYSSLYSLCNDCCALNDELTYSKKDLINNCENAKMLLAHLKNSGTNISESDLKTLNSYTEVLSKCLSSLSKNDSCKKCVKNVNNKKANLAQNCGSLNGDYLQIYNTLDSNCCSCNNCNMSVEDLISFVTKLLDTNNNGVTRNNVQNAPHQTKSNYTRNSRKTNTYQTNRTVESKLSRENKFERPKRQSIWDKTSDNLTRRGDVERKGTGYQTNQQSNNTFDRNNNNNVSNTSFNRSHINQSNNNPNQKTQNTSSQTINNQNYNYNRPISQRWQNNYNQNHFEIENKDVKQQESNINDNSEISRKETKELNVKDKLNSTAGPKVYTTKQQNNEEIVKNNNYNSSYKNNNNQNGIKQYGQSGDVKKINSNNNQIEKENVNKNGYNNSQINNIYQRQNQKNEQNLSSEMDRSQRSISNKTIPIKNTTNPPTNDNAYAHRNIQPNIRSNRYSNSSSNMNFGPKNVRANIA